jgi:predicted GTPase
LTKLYVSRVGRVAPVRESVPDPMKKVVIIGAAGRDFHNFNIIFRNNPEYQVVAFTATQIPGIEGRTYPPILAGSRYTKGIPIYSDKELARIIEENKVDLAVLAYSDLSYNELMHKASIALTAGADFQLHGPRSTMIKSKLPVVSVGAVRTGAGKSTVSRRVCQILKEKRRKVGVIRHPMPYGDLTDEVAQRFASYEDLDRYHCSIEEREEYEPHIDAGFIVYAGVDYQKVLNMAEKESDIIVWDGGNNDIPFIRPDLHIAVMDPLRAGDELTHYPSEVNIRMANVIVINKVDTAEPKKVELVESDAKQLAPEAIVVKAASEIKLDNPSMVKGKRVLVVEDGPTVIHGDLAYGVGYVAAKKFGAKEIIDPRPFAAGIVKEIFKKYAHLTQVLPTVGYGDQQIRDMEETIRKADCDTVVLATPADIRRIIKISKPTVRVSYYLKELTKPSLEDILVSRKMV